MRALLIIDIQNDYFPGGKMELVGSEAAAQNAARLLSCFREKKLPVFHVQHLAAQPGATFFLPDSHGAAFHDLVAPLAQETCITKNHPNAFYQTTLLQHLRASKVDSLVVAGMMTHMCVDTTVRAAYDYGLACTLAHDACATKDLCFEDETIPAHSVQGAYMAALNGKFASVEATGGIVENLSR